MKINQLILGIVAVTILVGIAFLVFSLFPEQKPEKPTDRVLTEDIGNAQEKSDLIRLSSPRPGEVVTSPLTIRGEARGYWFFEASFPIVLTDKNGRVLTGTIATAQSDWMTEEFVPFEAVLRFEGSQLPEGEGVLVLKRDNPSGLPENDDALKIPVSIGASGTGTMSDETLRQLFIEKYSKYSETLTVKIDKETSDYARGGVIFETGAPGGIFLATKIDGEWQIVFDGNGQISCDLSKYGFPTDILSDCTQAEGVQTDTGSTSYQNLIDYVGSNITEIISAYSAKKATNGKWFADGFGFTSERHMYVDFEDGHFLFRALLECESTPLTCKTLAIFEKQGA